MNHSARKKLKEIVLIIFILLLIQPNIVKTQTNESILSKDKTFNKISSHSTNGYLVSQNYYMPQKGDSLITIARAHLPTTASSAAIEEYAESIFQDNLQAFIGNHRNQLRRDQRLVLPEPSYRDNRITDKTIIKIFQPLTLPTITFLPILRLWPIDKQKNMPLIYPVLLAEFQPVVLLAALDKENSKADKKDKRPLFNLAEPVKQKGAFHYIWTVIWLATIIALCIWVFLVWRIRHFNIRKTKQLVIYKKNSSDNSNSNSNSNSDIDNFSIADFSIRNSGSADCLLATKDYQMSQNTLDGPSSFDAESLPSGRQAAQREIDFVNQGLQFVDDDRVEQALYVQLARSPRDIGALYKLAQFYADRKNITLFREQANLIFEETDGEGKLWQKIAALGRQLDPNDLLYNDQLDTTSSNDKTLLAYTMLTQDDLNLEKITNAPLEVEQNNVSNGRSKK